MKHASHRRTVQCFAFAARLRGVACWGAAALVPLVVTLACSGAEDSDADVQRFVQNPSPNPSQTTPGPSAPASGTPPAGTPPAGDPAGAGGEQVPPTAGLDTGGAVPANPAAPVPPEQPAAGQPVAGGASAGCGLSQGIPQNPAVPNTLIFFPPGYDGSTPTPLVFAFHGANRTNEDMRLVDSRSNGGELENNYVVAYMKSAGGGWDIGADAPRFEEALASISSQFCVDTAHIFAFGHSSGAQFIVQMLGDARTRETRFAGVVPVASSRYANPSWNPVPTFVIHGVNDASRGGDPDGADDIIQYTDSNQCTGGSQPVNVPACNSIADNGPVNAGCIQYSGCAAPVLFCNHDDPNYIDNGNPTNHGWPCFANSQIFQFFESLL